MTKYLRVSCLALLGFAAVSCADQTEEQRLPAGSSTAVEARVASFTAEGGASVLPGENDVDDLRAYLFKDGVLQYISDEVKLSDGSCTLKLPYSTGSLYMVGNAQKAGILGNVSSSSVGKLAETEWLASTASLKDGQAVSFFTGTAALDGTPGGSPVSLTLKRGVARFDVAMPSEEGIKVHRMTVKNAATSVYVFPQEQVSTPESAETQDLSVTFDEPLTANRAGVMYVYEQANRQLRVEFEVEDAGKSQTVSASLPAVLKRNAVYSLRIERENSSSELRLRVTEWEYADETEVRPGLDTKITIDQTASSLPTGSEVNGDGDVLTLNYLSSHTLLAVKCDSELEMVAEGNDAQVAPATDESGKPLRNRFTIDKALNPIGAPVKTVVLKFRRKGTEYFYDEDRITVKLDKNPTTLEGLLDLANDAHTHDFGTYADGEFGILSVPEGSEAALEFGEEDHWIKLEPIEGENGKYRILGGWHPNDPKADGREQAASLIIRAKGQAGKAAGESETYTIKRRNFGMPVTHINGLWWCKYNAMGNARDFNDQILVPNDPAAKAGKDLLEYLRDCTAEEYMRLWTSSSYEGDSGIALNVVEQNGKILLEGYKGNLTNINLLDPKALSPDGYELPSLEDYDRIFSVWTRFDRLDKDYGPYEVYGPWEGHKETFSRSYARSDLYIGEVELPAIIHAQIYTKKNGSKDESIVFYGPGAQWGSGGVNHNKVIYGCHSANEIGWFNPGGTNRFRRQKITRENTRILRFIKSPVEYIY